MPLKKDDSTNYEEYENVLMSARKVQEEVINTLGHRLKEVEDAEDEIIAKYIDCEELRLGREPSLFDCSTVQSYGQHLLNRITAIEAESLKVCSNLQNKRRPLHNAIFQALGSSGSADTRRARAEGATEVLNSLIEREEKLQRICTTVKQNIRQAQDMASKIAYSIRIEVEHLNGADRARELLEAAHQKAQEYAPRKLS